MIVVYILTNGVNKIHIIREKVPTFERNGIIYKVNQERVYLKKFLNAKFFRFSQYTYGDPEPHDLKSSSDDRVKRKITSVNYLGILLWKLKKLIWEKISVALNILIIIILIVDKL